MLFKVGRLYEQAVGIIDLVFGSAIRQSSAGLLVQMVVSKCSFPRPGIVYIAGFRVFLDIVSAFNEVAVIIILVFVAWIGRSIVIIGVVYIRQDARGLFLFTCQRAKE